MKTIWKFPIVVDDQPQTLQLSEGATVCHVGFSGGMLCMWVIVDTDGKRTNRQFLVRGTNHPIGDGEDHVGTVFDKRYGSPQMVWHVFEVRGAS